MDIVYKIRKDKTLSEPVIVPIKKDFLAKNKGYIDGEKYPPVDENGLDLRYRKRGKKIIVDQNATMKVRSVRYKNDLEFYIYSFYSKEKQSQDAQWKNYAETAIIALTAQAGGKINTDELTTEIAGTVLAVMAGQTTITDFVASKPEALQEHYKKLLKIGIRLKWAKNCIDEMKAALAEGRVPAYPKYPEDILEG